MPWKTRKQGRGGQRGTRFQTGNKEKTIADSASARTYMRKKIKEACGTPKYLPREEADRYYDAYNREIAERTETAQKIADEMYAQDATSEEIRQHLTKLHLPIPKEFQEA